MRKKLLCILTTIVIVFCGAYTVGCNGKKGEEVDSKRTQLYVSNFNGGYGDQWLRKIKQRFEEAQKDEVYEDGKKGVQIIIENAKITGVSLLGSLAVSRNEVFFTESAYYNDFLSGNLILDITDVVTENLTAFGETRSIEDKLTSYQKDFFSVNEKYYALPHYQSFRAMFYDVDLFEDEFLFFSANKNNGNGGFIVSATDERSPGPDGDPSTEYDNGLPATYDEFFQLCARMKSQGINPVSWTGKYQEYFTDFLTALATDYEGLDSMMLNFTLDGSNAETLIKSIDSSGNVAFENSTPVNKNNGYILSKQAGKYYALDFAEKLINNKYYSTKSFNTSQSHLDAQEDFLYSNFTSDDSIGILIEGVFWENEATEVFERMSKKYTEERAGKYSRRFGVMPFPKIEESGKVTLFDYLNSLSFINAKIANHKISLAKAFIQYCNTDESLREFTTTTNTPKALEYDLTNDDKNLMSYLGKSIWDMRNRADVVYPYSSNTLYRSLPSAFAHYNYWTTATHNVPSTAIRNDKITAKNYFMSVQEKFNETTWRSKFGNLLD